METHALLHARYRHSVVRAWHQPARLEASDLIYPLFICEQPDAIEAIEALPHQVRVGVGRLQEHLQPLVDAGLQAVLLFGVGYICTIASPHTNASITAVYRCCRSRA